MSNYLTTKDAADYLQVHEETVRRWVREEKLLGGKSGGILRFRTEDLDEMLVTSGPKRKLTKNERWILSNQYRILEALYPDETKQLRENREIIESGYELHYDSISQHIYGSDDTLTLSECKEVLDILDMFWALSRSNELLSDKSKWSPNKLAFPGFDGNDSLESKYMGYSRFYRESGDGRFKGFEIFHINNSHSQMLGVYRRMLPVWKSTKNKHQMTKEEMSSVFDAMIHPDNRK